MTVSPEITPWKWPLMCRGQAYSTINIRGEVLAITFVETQPPKQAAITLTRLIPILIGQFITSGSSSKPYSKIMEWRASGINFIPVINPPIAPNIERIKIPDVIDHLIFGEVIPMDL